MSEYNEAEYWRQQGYLIPENTNEEEWPQNSTVGLQNVLPFDNSPGTAPILDHSFHHQVPYRPNYVVPPSTAIYQTSLPSPSEPGSDFYSSSDFQHPSTGLPPDYSHGQAAVEYRWPTDVIDNATLGVGVEDFAWVSPNVITNWFAHSASVSPDQPMAHMSSDFLATPTPGFHFQHEPMMALEANYHVVDNHSFIPTPPSNYSASSTPKMEPENWSNRAISTQIRHYPVHKSHKPSRGSKIGPKGISKNTAKLESKISGSQVIKFDGACWRCKRYRKACFGQGVCTECSTTGFRIWPSEIGCRRGGMEVFVESLMPTHAEQALWDAAVEVNRTANWRLVLNQSLPGMKFIYEKDPTDQLQMLKDQVAATMLFGPEFVTLVDILGDYQKSRKKEIACLTECCNLLFATCSFYHYFVNTSSSQSDLKSLIDATTKFRHSLLRCWNVFLQLCLSGRRDQLFPAVLVTVFVVCSMVIFMDACASVPPSVQAAIWGDGRLLEVCTDLRARQYMMALDLLRISTKGANPLKMNYWTVEETTDLETGKKTMRRNPKGMALLAHDEAAFDGFMALKSWHESYQSILRTGKDVFARQPFTYTNLQPISAVGKIFEF